MTTHENNPFLFVNSIYEHKRIDFDEYAEKHYSPFIINKALSFGPDTIIPANEMNCRPHLQKRMQYEFLFSIVEPKKRFNRWLKRPADENVAIIMQHYNYNYKKALSVAPLFSKDHINYLKGLYEDLNK